LSYTSFSPAGLIARNLYSGLLEQALGPDEQKYWWGQYISWPYQYFAQRIVHWFVHE